MAQRSKLGGFSFGKSNKVSVRLMDVVKQLSLGMGIGIVSDGLIEVTRLPVLNDTGTFGNSDISNFELFFYGISIAGIAAGIIDIGTGKGILTFTKSMIFYLVGLIVGVYFYENTLSTLFKIRKLNPYDIVTKYVPAVLPSDTKLPFLPGGQFGPAAGSPSAWPVPPKTVAPSIS